MHSDRVPSHDEILQAFRRAGFTSLTPFQEKSLPLVLKGKDFAAEIRSGSGATTACIAPLIIALRGANPDLRVLILCPDAQETAKVSRAYTRFSRALRDAPSFVPLGEIEDERREQRRLEKGATIVAGTVERVIDHLRRGSLVLDTLTTLVMTEPGPETRPDFIKDVQFMFTRIKEKPQAILLSRSPLAESEELVQLLHHPTILDSESTVQALATPADNRLFTVDASSRTSSLVRLLVGAPVASAVVFFAPRSDPRAISAELTRAGLRPAILPAAASLGSRQQTERRAAIVALAARSLDVLLVALGAGAPPSDLEEAAPSHFVFYDLPASGNRIGAAVLLKGARVMALVDKGQDRDLTRMQEAIGMAFSKGEIPNDDEVLAGAIDRMLQRVKDGDQAELTRLRARIRRQVPLRMRSLFMAALLKAQLGSGQTVAAPNRPRPASGVPQTGTDVSVPPKGQRGRFGRNTPAAAPKPVRQGEPPRTPRAEPRAPRGEPRREGQFAQLFVSIGRNRRVYARDLTELFTEKLQLTPGEIGGVRVFDKYSFVDIVPARAEEAISKITGTELKGRPITVNYAKKKEEKEEA